MWPHFIYNYFGCQRAHVIIGLSQAMNIRPETTHTRDSGEGSSQNKNGGVILVIL